MSILNITYKGRLYKESQLEKSVLQDEAIVIDDENVTTGGAMAKGVAIILPFLLLMVCYSGTYFYKVFATAYLKETFPGEYLLTALVGIVALMLSLPIHELIHALCYPMATYKEIYRWPEKGVWFMYSTAALRRSRFVAMCMTPMLILGVLPFLLFMVVKNDMSVFASFFLALFAISSCVSAAGDCYNSYIALNRAAKNSELFNSIKNTYATKVVSNERPKSRRLLTAVLAISLLGIVVGNLSYEFSLCMLLTSLAITSFIDEAPFRILKWLDFSVIMLLSLCNAINPL